MGRYGGRQEVNYIIHPKFPFLTWFISLCFHCLTEVLGCSSSHLCLRCRCQWLSYPAPVRLNRDIINAVSERDFSDQSQTWIITQTALAIPDGCSLTVKGSPSWPAGLCTCIAHSHNVSIKFSPHTHYTCHTPKSSNGLESCIQKIIHMQAIRIHSSIQTDSEQCLNPVPKLSWIQRAQTYPVWPKRFGVMMHKQVILDSKVPANQFLAIFSYYVFILSGTLQ